MVAGARVPTPLGKPDSPPGCRVFLFCKLARLALKRGNVRVRPNIGGRAWGISRFARV
jgi:hypothetical protein